MERLANFKNLQLAELEYLKYLEFLIFQIVSNFVSIINSLRSVIFQVINRSSFASFFERKKENFDSYFNVKLERNKLGLLDFCNKKRFRLMPRDAFKQRNKI